MLAQLRGRAAKAIKDSDCSVAVGYTAAYALYVHENIEMVLAGQPRPTKGNYWDPQGRAQAKFLEAPFRDNASNYARIINNAMKRGNTLAQALVLAGLQLQRDSQLLVPVDTGNLKASAFTRLEVPARGGGENVGDAGSQSE